MLAVIKSGPLAFDHHGNTYNISQNMHTSRAWVMFRNNTGSACEWFIMFCLGDLIYTRHGYNQHFYEGVGFPDCTILTHCKNKYEGILRSFIVFYCCRFFFFSA